MKFQIKMNEARMVYRSSEYEEIDSLIYELREFIPWLKKTKQLTSSDEAVVNKAIGVLSDVIKIHGLEAK